MDGDIKVTVDNTFARFGAKSYAINKINSVEIRERKPHGIVGLLFFGVLTVLFGLAGFGAMVGPSPTDEGARYVVLAVIFAGLTYLCVRRHRIIEYQLFLMTSSSEAQAFQTRDKERVFELRTSIEEAMVASAAN